VREVALRRLVTGPPAPADRVALVSVWFAAHNNPRYAELLPRLERLDACLLRLPEQRLAGGVGFRAWMAARPVFLRAALPRAGARYRNLLALDFDHLRHWPGAAVMDADDPTFTSREVARLNTPALRAYVVTAERAARRYEQLGVDKPWVVIPQGVNLAAATQVLRAELAGRRRAGEVVIGWIAAHLLTTGDRGGDNPLYNIDHLLELWDHVHARIPVARLWLVGGASDRVQARLAQRDDVLLLGRLPRERALAAAANFDVAVYARTADQGIQAAKVAELTGLGVPIVSYDYEVTADLRKTGAGILVPDSRSFVDAVVRLAADPEARGAVSSAARRAGLALDWDILAERYAELVLDRFLPAG
jgi:glycosyltransferase involved in cell wall biosynthesis